MAEVVGVVASVVTTTGIANSIVKLKTLWDQIRDAPEDIGDLIEKLSILGSIIDGIEDNLWRGPASGLILDSNSMFTCLQHCKKCADHLKDLVDHLSADLGVSDQFKNKRASAKVVLKKAQLERHKAKLERAISLLTLFQQLYTSGLVQLQLDVFVASWGKSSKPADTGYQLQDPTPSRPFESRTALSQRDSISASLSSYYNSWEIVSIFGRFRYSRKSHLSAKKRCTGSVRRRHEIEEYVVEYWSPSWLTSRLWSMRAVKAPSGWMFCPRMRIVIPGDSPVFKYARENNIQGLQELFSQRLASPFDCDESGTTALVIAAWHGSFQVCELLVTEGADPVNGIPLPLKCVFTHKEAYFEAVETRLLLYKSECKIDSSRYKTSAEDFTAWQQNFDPYCSGGSIGERVQTAIALAIFSIGPEMARRALPPGPISLLAQGITHSYNQRFLNVAALNMGTVLSRWGKCDQFKGWQSLVKESLSLRPDIHNIGPGSRTPLGTFLYGFSWTLRSVDDSLQRSANVTKLLNMWLSFLGESDVDLEAYGRKEVALHEQGVSSWNLYDDWDPCDDSLHRYAMNILAYGPTLNDWRITVDPTDSMAEDSTV